MKKCSLLLIALPPQFSEAITPGVQRKGSLFSFELRVSQVTQYLTQQEVGSLLSISERTVRTWSRKGVLRAYRFGTRVFYKRHEVAQQLATSKSRKP